MYKIFKITSHHVVDFAAEELKKYLRMMMPRCGEISIEYNPNATDGFRLGLMQDFGIDVSEAPNIELDDILHIDTDENGGIIAGDNPRSVLLAVYRYLTINGCRWLFSGVDGEYIPIKSIEPVNYHKMADCRYRGQCNEGAEFQPNMIEAIDFTPKIGMNIFMMEFDIPKSYYDQYYEHKHNTANRDPEPITFDQVIQWKRQCEAELKKRGLEFHDVGHGWPVESFGIKTNGWEIRESDEVDPEIEPFIAQTNGKRGLWKGMPINTQFCMSNPEARARVTMKVCDYAELATNVDYLHVWLADGSHNHCECDECRKKTPSDWYVMLMNDIDAELTKRKLSTRIVFCCYVDTTWAPKKEKINNPDRFSLLVAPIYRSYVQSVDGNLDLKTVNLTEYELNISKFPRTVNEYVAYGKKWTDMQKIPCFMYEYHFWLIQFRDLGQFDSARILHEDIKGYHKQGSWGLIEDGSQRSFFPNGFQFFVYGNTLFDTGVDFDALKEDYFKHAYGEDYKEVIAFFEKLGKLADFRYFNKKLSSDESKGMFYNPEFTESLKQIPALIDEFAPFVEAHKNMPKRVQTVAYRVLRRYLEYCKSLSYVFVQKALGNDDKARDDFYKFLDNFGKYELEMERWYDHFLVWQTMSSILGERNLQMM